MISEGAPLPGAVEVGGAAGVVEREELLSWIEEFMQEYFELTPLGSIPGKKLLREFTEWASVRAGAPVGVVAYAVFYRRLRALGYNVPQVSRDFGYNTSVRGLRRKH